MGTFRPHLSYSDTLPAEYQIRIDLSCVLRTNQTSNREGFFARLSGEFQFHAKDHRHIYVHRLVAELSTVFRGVFIRVIQFSILFKG